LTVFADSSALVKLYVAEDQHQSVRQIVDPIVVSVLAEVEVRAAIWRKHRRGEISVIDASLLCAEFEADLAGDDLPAPRFAVIGIGEEVIRAAIDAVARHPLRAYDAVQLASALTLRSALDGLEGFVAFDIGLRAAAAAEGLTLVPETVES
jgi:predicted nucleic acid-binding protein